MKDAGFLLYDPDTGEYFDANAIASSNPLGMGQHIDFDDTSEAERATKTIKLIDSFEEASDFVQQLEQIIMTDSGERTEIEIVKAVVKTIQLLKVQPLKVR